MKLLALIMTGGILASLLYTNLVEDRLNSLEDQVASANYRWLMTLRAVNTRLDELPRPVPPQVEKRTPKKSLKPRIDLLEKKMDAVMDVIVQDQLEKALEQEMRRQLVPAEPSVDSPFKSLPECGSPGLTTSTACIDYGPGRTKL